MQILFSIFYEIGLFLISLAFLPKALYEMAVKKKYRNSILKRFGSGFPIIIKGKRPLIWIHAVSLGETKAVTALAKSLKSQFKNPILVFSTTTETGHVEACRTIPADYHVYLPFDFGWVVRPIIKRTAPDLVVLCESDFWYNFLDASKKVGAKTILVNGKVSTSSADRFSKFNFFTKRLFALIDIFCVQSHLYKKRFEALGVPEEKIIVTGNMKFDGDYAKLPPVQLEAWRKELGIENNQPVLVIGSSHAPEEVQLLKVLSTVWEKYPNLKVMVVPRHPERFNEVAGILQKNNVSFRRLSQKHSDPSSSVILIDAMGLLRKCYQLADVAIVAGSYTSKVGGHNILEPSWYGVPVIFGPHMHSQPDMVDLVNEYGAGMQVTLDELEGVLVHLFEDSEKRKSIGSFGLKLAGDVHGATEKTLNVITSQISTSEKRSQKASKK